MKSFIFLIILLFQNPAFSKIIENYRYPFTKPYMATVLSAMGGSNVPFPAYENILINHYPERKHLLRNSRIELFNASLLRHKGQKKPLVFVLGGFGSHTLEGNVRLLAHHLHTTLGFHVLALSSQSNWYNALTTDKNLMRGDLFSDLKNYQNFMKQVLAKVKAMGLKYSSISITGYSAGGATSLFLAKQDKQDGFFNFKTVVAINPPINMFHAAGILDEAYKGWMQYTKKQKKILVDKSYAFYFKITEQASKKNKNILKFIFKNFPYTEQQANHFISYNFLGRLVDYLKISEAVNKTGLLKNLTTVSTPGIFDYRVGFLQYFHKFLYPFHLKRNPQISLKEFLYRSSLYSLKNFLSTSSNVFIQHNQDDTLLLEPKKNLEFLESVLGDRIFIYPTGGHLGNLWFPTNIEHFLSFFTK